MKHWFSGNLYPLSIQIPTKRSGPHEQVLVLGKGTGKEQEGVGSSPPFHFVNGFDLFPMLLGSLRSKVSFLCLFQWFQDCVSKVSFFLFRSGNRIICSLARAFKLSLFFKFFKFFIFNKLCTLWGARVSAFY